MKFQSVVRILRPAVFLVLVGWPLSGEITLRPESKLWLVGNSTLHAYSSTATELKFTMTVDPTAQEMPLYHAILAGQMKSADVRVPVKMLKSERTQLDQNMYKALKADANPDIRFHMTGYEVQPSTASTMFPIIATGELSIAGQTKTVPIPMNVMSGTPVRLEGAYSLLMSDYGVKPPKILLLKTDDRVVIHFDLLLQ